MYLFLISGGERVMEAQRIDFLLRRDGLEKTREFARMAISQYYKATEDPKYKGKWDNMKRSIYWLTSFLGRAK